MLYRSDFDPVNGTSIWSDLMSDWGEFRSEENDSSDEQNRMALDADFNRDDDSSDLVFRLPRRDLGAFRWVSLVFIPFGLFFCSIPIAMIVPLIGDLLQGEFFVIVPILFCSLFVIAGTIPIAAGLFLWIGKAELRLTASELIDIERCGFLRWSWKCDRFSIEKVVLNVSKSRKKRTDSDGKSSSGLTFLTVQKTNGKPIIMGIGYPPEILEPVAAKLMQAIFDLSEAPEVEVQDLETYTDELGNPNFHGSSDFPVSKPANSDIELVDHPGGIALKVPPSGIWKGSKGLMLFSGCWSAFSTVFFVVLLGVAIGGEDVPLFAFGFIGLFVLIGVGIGLCAVNMGVRKAMIAFDGDRFKLVHKNLFRERREDWGLEEIDRFQIGPSGMEVNDVPVMCMFIHFTDGTKEKFFSSRTNEEIHWMADVFNRKLPHASEPKPIDDDF